MVKLKTAYIGVTAINTGMSREIVMNSLPIFSNYPGITLCCAIFINLGVVLIMNFVCLTQAFFAPSLMYSFCFIVPGEIVDI